MSHQTFEFDTFISYSHKDAGWVRSTLLPVLEKWEVRYLIDFRGFEPGRSLVSEMERACRESRTVILVLTPAYLESSYTHFEYQVGRGLDASTLQRRVIPILREPCQPPPLLRGIVRVLLTDPIDEAQWSRLYESLVESGSPQKQLIGGRIDVSQDIPHGHGYAYRLDLLVGNPLPVEISYDSISLRYHTSVLARSGNLAVREQILAVIEDKLCTFFYYGKDRPPMAVRGEAGRVPSMQTLSGQRAFQMRSITTGNAPPSVPGQEPTRLSVQLLRRGVPVSESLWCALPPVLRLPLLHRVSEEGATRLELVPACYLPTESGVTEGDRVGVLFDAAYGAARDAQLLRVRPEAVTVHTFNENRYRHTTHDWVFEFFSPASSKTLTIHADDPTYVRKPVTTTGPRPRLWLGHEHLKNCLVDCRAADLIADVVGSQHLEKGVIEMVPGLIDGVLAAVWRLPVMLAEKAIGVVATSGEVATPLQEDEWTKVKGCIWNR